MVANPIPKLGGADFDIQPGEKVEGGGFSGGIVEQAGSDCDFGAGLFRAGHGIHGQTLGQCRPQIVKPLAGPRGDDQRCRKGDLRRAMPASQRKKRVGAHEAKKSAFGRELGAQAVERLQGEVGGARGLWRIGERNREPRLVADGQASHGHAVWKAGGGTMGLERLRADRGEEHGIEAKRRTGSARHGQMTQMGRVKTAAEEGNATAGAWWLVHSFMVSRAGALVASDSG